MGAIKPCIIIISILMRLVWASGTCGTVKDFDDKVEYDISPLTKEYVIYTLIFILYFN